MWTCLRKFGGRTCHGIWRKSWFFFPTVSFPPAFNSENNTTLAFILSGTQTNLGVILDSFKAIIHVHWHAEFVDFFPLLPPYPKPLIFLARITMVPNTSLSTPAPLSMLCPYLSPSITALSYNLLKRCKLLSVLVQQVSLKHCVS